MTDLIIPRRRFLAGLAATLAAPAIARAGVLMPVRTPAIWRPAPSRLPAGWIECDGRELHRAVYPDLYAAISNRYGGEGPLFRVPDLRPPNGWAALPPSAFDVAWGIGADRLNTGMTHMPVGSLVPMLVCQSERKAIGLYPSHIAPQAEQARRRTDPADVPAPRD